MHIGVILICFMLLVVVFRGLDLETSLCTDLASTPFDAFLLMQIFSLFFIAMLENPFLKLVLDLRSFSKLSLFREFSFVVILDLDVSNADDFIRADTGCDVSEVCAFWELQACCMSFLRAVALFLPRD